MYEITFCDTGQTVQLLRMEAEDMFGQDEFQEILDGHQPHIVAVQL